MGESLLFILLTAFSLLALLFIWGILIHLFPRIGEPQKSGSLFGQSAVYALEHMGPTLRALLICAVLLAAQVLYFPASLPLTLSIGIIFPALACAFAHVPKS